MSNLEPADIRVMTALQQKIAEMKSADAVAQRLKESYIRYVVLANAGGLAACGTLIGGKGVALAGILGPVICFLVGLVAGGLIVSLMGKQATHRAEQLGQEVIKMLQDTGQMVATPKPVFSAIERKGLPIIEGTINVLGLVSQFAFVGGAAWGLALIGIAH
jgi:hypothetical protein